MIAKIFDTDDIDSVRHLWLDLNKFHFELDSNFSRRFHCADFDSHKGYLRDKEYFCVFVAVVEEDLVGFCIAIVDNGKGEIDSLYVVPNARRIGAGKKLIRSALEWMRKSCGEIVVLIAQGNESVISFYASEMFKLRYYCFQWEDKGGETQG